MIYITFRLNETAKPLLEFPKTGVDANSSCNALRLAQGSMKPLTSPLKDVQRDR